MVRWILIDILVCFQRLLINRVMNNISKVINGQRKIESPYTIIFVKK